MLILHGQPSLGAWLGHECNNICCPWWNGPAMNLVIYKCSLMFSVVESDWNMVQENCLWKSYITMCWKLWHTQTQNYSNTILQYIQCINNGAKQAHEWPHCDIPWAQCPIWAFHLCQQLKSFFLGAYNMLDAQQSVHCIDFLKIHNAQFFQGITWPLYNYSYFTVPLFTNMV